jgi:glutathione S-transferase
MYLLYIANKNYSSWSLRPWVLMRELGIRFDEQLITFGDEAAWRKYLTVSPAGKVPALRDGETLVWDSFGITEYVAERHAGVWPKHATARAWARCAAAEMHSGFSALRNTCSMSCGIRVRLHEIAAPLRNDLARLTSLWSEGLKRFGGPFLAGESFTAVDAYFAPVAFRIQTYGLDVPADARAYVDRLLGLRSMQEWYRAGLAETTRDAPHDEDVVRHGTVVEDLRAPAAR